MLCWIFVAFKIMDSIRWQCKGVNAVVSVVYSETHKLSFTITYTHFYNKL